MDRETWDTVPRTLLRPTEAAPLNQYDLERRRAVILRQALAPGMSRILPPWTGDDLELARERAANATLPPALYPEGKPR